MLDYQECRGRMQPGDLIAFGGKGRVSEVIKGWTRSPVSHVGVVLQRRAVGDDSDRFFNELIESTSLEGASGVTTVRMSSRLKSYDGEVWWLPLRAQVRDVFDQAAFFNFLFAQDGKAYDTKQALQAGVDAGIWGRLLSLAFPVAGPWVGLTEAREDFDKFFCSELVTAGYEAAGILPSVNASEVTPADLIQVDLFSGWGQLQGEPTPLLGVATVPVGTWSQGL